MATIINKHKLVNQIFTTLGKGYKPSDVAKPQVLEQFIYALCREGATREAADQAYQALADTFFDWNEIRVSSPREVADILDEHLPDGEVRAQRLIEFLQEVFETTFSFDLEALQKKGFKQAAKQLARYHAANDYAVAWVVQQSLGGHAIPLDGQTLRVLRRLGILEEDETDLEALRASLEHQIPKARGTDFVDLISALAAEHCWEDDPSCPACPLHKTCPTGIEMKAPAVAASKKPR
ncbi:MAG: endonuclease [Planctomycetes bacterium]|nr:endonuclease [Planctomycetota bacterium]